MSFLLGVLYCHVEVFATSRSHVRRSPTEWCVCVRDKEASTVRRPWPNGDYCAAENS